MSDELDRFNTVIQLETDSEESIETFSESLSSSSPESSSSSPESSSSSESLDFENEHNIFLTNMHQESFQQLQRNNNKSVSTPDFYCFSCKNRYFINIIGSTMTHCALCSSSTTKLHNNNVNNVHFSDYNGWKEFTKGWSGL